MTTPLGFDALKGILHRRLAPLPDHRKASPNTRYALHDAALSAFGIFFTQSPSFLEYQRRLQHAKGHNNAHTLFDVEQIPCDNQVRTLLDPIAPKPPRCGVSGGLCVSGTTPHVGALSGPWPPTLGGPRWHQLLFVHSHSLPKLPSASAQQWPNPLLSCRAHPGNCVPWPRPGHCLAAGVHHAARRA